MMDKYHIRIVCLKEIRNKIDLFNLIIKINSL